MFFVSFGGGRLENIFCNFYEINSSRDSFCIAKNFGVDGTEVKSVCFCISGCFQGVFREPWDVLRWFSGCFFLSRLRVSAWDASSTPP